jgi:hypothetical protein
MDNAAFFNTAKKSLFRGRLNQRQVDGIAPYLKHGNHLPLTHLAHNLAEVYHETGGQMYPVKETVYASSRNKNPSDATVIRRLDSAWKKGQLSWVKTPYWRDGWFGRGGIQITHKYNYSKLSEYVGVDLVANPDAALDPVIAAKIAIAGLEFGLFTGEKLSDFDLPDGSFDHDNARSMVNGDERRPVGDGLDMGDKIEGYALKFEAALRSAGYAPQVARDTVNEPASMGWIGQILRLLGVLK